MSKKVLLLCVALAGVCGADDAEQEVVETGAIVEAVGVSTELAADSPQAVAPSYDIVEAIGASTEPAADIPQAVAPSHDIVDVELPENHELPGIRIDQGPVTVVPSYGCSEENVEALAHATVQALHATLSDVAASLDQAAHASASAVASVSDVSGAVQNVEKEVGEASDAVQNAAGEISEAVQAIVGAVTGNGTQNVAQELGEAAGALQAAATEVGQAVEAIEHATTTSVVVTQYIPAIIELITSYYAKFVEFFTQGWKYMVYTSVNSATKHIILAAEHRNIPVDLSALAIVNACAVECFTRMNDAKNAILEAAELRSPQLKQAAALYLSQYENWFTGTSEALVDQNATASMLECLGVRGLDPALFSKRNMDYFRSLGGQVRHANLFLVVSPSPSSGLTQSGIDAAVSVAQDEVRAVVDSADQISKVSGDIAERAVEQMLVNEIIEGITHRSPEDK